MRLSTILLVISFFTSLNAYAHEESTNYNRVSLDAAASTEIANDTIIVELYAQEEGSRADELSERVNEQINQALEHLKAHSEIEVATKNYSVQPVYNKSQIVGWRVRQSIELRSKDIALLSGKLGELQRYLKLGQLSFDVSAEQREEITRSLIDQALDAFNRRAEQISKRLARSSYKIVSMKVVVPDSASPYRFRVAHSMAEASAVTAPEFAPGKNTLKVRIDGMIELE